MVINNVYQREIVEVPFMMPNGVVLSHPALVLSKSELQEVEDGLFYAVLISTKNHHPEFTIKIMDEWLNKPLLKQSYFVTHIVDKFTVEDVMRRTNTYIKPQFFDLIIEKIIENIIG